MKTQHHTAVAIERDCDEAVRVRVDSTTVQYHHVEESLGVAEFPATYVRTGTVRTGTTAARTTHQGLEFSALEKTTSRRI